MISVQPVLKRLKSLLRQTAAYDMVKRGARLWESWRGLRHPIQDVRSSDGYDIKTLGTEYGGWSFVEESELEGSVLISAGLGEDASFDVEFAKQYNADVITVDPTPRAVEHYKSVKEGLDTPKSVSYNHDGAEPIGAYDLESIGASQLNLVEKALWHERGELKFYEPKDPSHVSHSALNWQNDYVDDTDYITVESDTLDSVLSSKDVRLDEVQIIKLDIEGAEIEVIEDMLKKDMYPPQILIEFDELHNPSSKAFSRIDGAHEALLGAGYKLIHSDGVADFLYYRAS